MKLSSLSASSLVRYGLTVAVVLVTLLLRWALIPIIGPGTLYITLFPAMMMVAVTLGLGPGLAGNALGIVLIEHSLVEPVGQVPLTLSLAVRSSIMLLTAFYVGRVGDKLRAARQRAEQEATTALAKEQALRESETRYRTLFDSMSEGFAVHEILLDGQGRPIDYRFLDLNPAFERLTGLKREGLLGRCVREALPGTEDYWIDNYGKVALTGQPVHFESFSAPLNRWYEVFAYRPAPDQFAVVFTDITERKGTEEALAKAHEQTEADRRRLEAILETIPVGVVLIEASTGRLSYINQQAAEIYGTDYGGFDLEAHHARARALKPDGTPYPLEGMPVGHALKGEAVHNDEMTIERGDGVRVPVVVSSAPLLDTNGKVTSAVVVFDDITGLKKAEEALRRYELLARHSRDIILFMNYDGGRLLEVNAAAVEAYGYTREELLERTIQDLRAAETQELTAAQMAEAAGRGILFETVHRRKDGTTFPVEVSSQGALIGQVRTLISVIRDITERKQAERALEKARDDLVTEVKERTRELCEKEVLLKEVHHRVKNNLQIISSLVGLQADGSKDDTVRRVLRDVTDRIRSMALVHEKLYQSPDLARVDFAEYVRSLLGYLWRAHGAAAAVQLTLDLEPVSLPVDTAVPCGLILNELAGNALKHAFRGRSEGEVDVSLKRTEGDRISLRLRDNGIGLPAGFDWREARSLGLRLVQMLAGQLKATVEVRSAQGTEFEVSVG